MTGNNTYKSCPTAMVNAPVEVVWKLLTEPARWGDFFDVRIRDVRPPGPAAKGQHVEGETGWKFLHLKVTFDFLEVDHERHRLRLDIELPFWFMNHEELECAPLGTSQCGVHYNCNFVFPDGRRGKILRTLIGRRLDTGPADSIARLKKAAESAAG